MFVMGKNLLFWVERASIYGLVRVHLIGSTVAPSTGGHVVSVSPSQV